MNHKSFLNKSGTMIAKSNPEKIISDHEKFIRETEKCSSVLEDLKENKISGTIALESIRKIVFEEMLNNNIQSSLNPKKQSVERTPSKYIAEILDKEQNVATKIVNGKVVPLRKGFNDSNEADSWLTRQLAENSAEGYFGRVSSTFTRSSGQPFVHFVERLNAFANYKRKKPGPVCKRMSKRTASLTSRMRVKG